MMLPRNDLKKAELARFWKDAYLAAMPDVMANPWSQGNKKLADTAGVSGVCADLADEAVRLLRKRFS